MKKIMLILICIPAWAPLPACNGSSTPEDGDADPAGDPDATPDEGDVPAEGDIVEDGVTDEPVESELPPACASQGIECGGRSSGTVGDTSGGNLDKYFVNGRPLEYDEQGGEFVFAFETGSEVLVSLEINDYSEGDLDILVLKERCDPEAAIAFGDSVASFRAAPGILYYILVDGRDGSSGGFELMVDCSETFERCGNSIDDNGDDLVDCADPQCRLQPPCFELYCSDGADDDLDGDVDCADFDCIGAASCAGGPGAIGDPCDSHADCQTGKCYMELETGWPGGYCIQVSDITTCEGMECPEDTECEPIGFVSVDGPWACARECSESEPCREGYLCEDHLCFPLCTSADQCIESGYCEYNHGLCTTEPTEICTGGVDEDGDGDVDCDDTQCMFKEICVASVHLEGGDTCADAVELPLPSGERGTVVVTGTTEPAGDDFLPSCEAIDSSDVVYTFTLAAPALARIDLVGGRIEPRIQDTILALKQDCAGDDIACNNDISEGVYSHSYIEIDLSAGTYFIIVDGFDGLAGDYNLGLNLAD
jgi:hypothetical protein